MSCERTIKQRRRNDMATTMHVEWERWAHGMKCQADEVIWMCAIARISLNGITQKLNRNGATENELDRWMRFERQTRLWQQPFLRSNESKNKSNPKKKNYKSNHSRQTIFIRCRFPLQPYLRVEQWYAHALRTEWACPRIEKCHPLLISLWKITEM